MVSRRLESCLYESVLILDTFWTGLFSEIQDCESESFFTLMWPLNPLFSQLKVDLKVEETKFPGSNTFGKFQSISIFTQPLRSGRIWHKVNFLAEFNRFEFFCLNSELSFS